MLKTTSELRDSFMKEFVHSLIKNTPYKEFIPDVEEFQQSQFLKQLPQTPSMPRLPSRPPLPRLPRPPRLPQLPLSQSRSQPPMRSSFRPQLSSKSTQLPRGQPPNVRPSATPTTNEKINLGRITKFLLDPSVISVESPGPGKNIVVNQSGKIQSTSVSLSKEEIENIMNEISDKTRIPIIPGLFKAVFQDLLITAVTSEFVGSRFIIQKRTPFTKY